MKTQLIIFSFLLCVNQILAKQLDLLGHWTGTGMRYQKIYNDAGDFKERVTVCQELSIDVLKKQGPYFQTLEIVEQITCGNGTHLQSLNLRIRPERNGLWSLAQGEMYKGYLSAQIGFDILSSHRESLSINKPEPSSQDAHFNHSVSYPVKSPNLGSGEWHILWEKVVGTIQLK